MKIALFLFCFSFSFSMTTTDRLSVIWILKNRSKENIVKASSSPELFCQDCGIPIYNSKVISTNIKWILEGAWSQCHWNTHSICISFLIFPHPNASIIHKIWEIIQTSILWYLMVDFSQDLTQMMHTILFCTIITRKMPEGQCTWISTPVGKSLHKRRSQRLHPLGPFVHNM